MTTYKDAGVDKQEGYRTVAKIKQGVSSTHNSNVLGGLGSFGALYALKGYGNPVLVSGTDGVGTKLRLALDTKNYQSIGIDCFAMCVNDILCHGAKPLFFLDYIACGKLQADVAAQIIEGMVVACKQTQTALVGGETAEMPGMYAPGDYDVAGFCVGVVERENIINGKEIKEKDLLVALPSSGLHSNGFSLVRKIFSNFNEPFENKPLYQTLLTPTRLYVEPVLSFLEKVPVKGLAHITGGGLYENLPRIIPDGLTAVINKKEVLVPDIFHYIKQKGAINEEEMWGTFNMGVGMVVVVSSKDAQAALNHFKSFDLNAYILGEVMIGREKIVLKDSF